MANPFFGSVTDNLTRLGEKMRVLPELSGEAVVVDEIISSINSPMLIMVMGEFSTGKSTFINALVKKDIATVGAQPTTAVITKLSYGTQDKIEVVFRDGTRKVFDSNEFSRLTAEESKAENDNLHETIDYVSRTLPIDILKNMTIVDSPGLNSLKPIHAETTRKFMDKADTVIWLFSADTPAKQTEIDALKRLNPRLSPIVVLNKIDAIDEEEGESVESIIADIDRKLRNNKIKAQKFIGLSAKSAFEGARKNNPKLIAAGNIGEFYNVVNNVIVPNRDNYKQNSLFDEIAYLIKRLSVAMDSIRAKKEFLREENFSEYEKKSRNLTDVENGLKSFFSVFAKHVGENPNASEEYLLGTFYYNQFVPVDNAQANYSEALAHFRKAADLGHHYAMATIGDMYNLGVGVQQNYSEALKWFQKAAECGNAEALSCIGTLYYDGAGVEQNYKKAAEFYTKAADLGDLMATNNLAYMYQEGLGIRKNLSKARSLFEKAAAAGIPEAMTSLANIYGEGLGVTKNVQEAAKWILKAAEAGNAEAMLRVCSMYEQGEGVAKDLQKAAYWLKEAAVHGNTIAMAGLGISYLFGKHWHKQSDQNAIKWFKKAADLGDKDASFWLAYMYHKGKGINQNHSEAFKWYKRAADSGNKHAFGQVGKMYYDGEGVSQNYFEAFKWLKKAAETDDKRTYLLLGLMYQEGEGTNRDYFEAFKWYKKAADNDVKNAYCGLGTMYYNGEGVSQNYFEAFKWFKKAADSGDEIAYCWLGIMYRQGEGVSQNYSQALDWFLKAADNGVSSAIIFIARMYRYGEGVTQDYDAAFYWYQKAIDAGNDSARTEKAELQREIEAEKERERQKTAAASSNIREDNSNTTMVIGAGIGLFIGGPIGAAVGGWIGKKFFGR